MNRRSSISLTLAASLTVLAVVAASRGGDPSPAEPTGPRAELTAADGAFREDPRAGVAVFEASGVRPGEQAAGIIRVRNAGERSGLFFLKRAGLDDRPGPNGGRLSERLELAVLDVSEPGAPAVVYTGGVRPLGVRPLGVLAPGASRTYSVTASAITGQTPTVSLGGGDPYERSTTRIALSWEAVEALPLSRLTALLGPRDRNGPRLALVAPPRQRVIDIGRLDMVLRCSEPCRAEVTARVLLGRPATVPVEGAGEGLRRALELRLALASELRRDLSEALGAGRSVAIELRARASDRAGNESVLSETVNLRPKR